MKTIKVGILGFGTVGSGVVRLLTEQREMLSRRLGTDLVLKKVADLEPDRPRAVTLDRDRLTNKAADILNDPEIDIVVELIGGCGAARKYMLAGIDPGKPVVTANKALLAEHGDDLSAPRPQKRWRSASKPASAAASPSSAPSARPGRQPHQLFGILNGTCNYILTRMARQGSSLPRRSRTPRPGLRRGRSRPRHRRLRHRPQAASCGLAYGARRISSPWRWRHRQLDPLDMQYALEFGYRLKLLAVTRDDGHGWRSACIPP